MLPCRDLDQGGGVRLIGRRTLFRTAGLALLAVPLETRAQSGKTAHRIGFLGAASAAGYVLLIEALRQGLRDHGYVEGQNTAIEYRWADGQYDRVPALASELVRLKVDIIITQGTPAALAARRATRTIPSPWRSSATRWRVVSS